MKKLRLTAFLVSAAFLVVVLYLCISSLSVIDVVSGEKSMCSPGSPVSATVRIRNFGLRSLRISSIRTSCNCIQNQISTSRIPFLGDSTIHLSITCPDRAKTRTVYLMCRTSDLIRAERFVRFQVVRRDRVAFGPRVFRLGNVGTGKTITRAFRIAYEGYQQGEIEFRFPTKMYTSAMTDKNSYDITRTNASPPGEIDETIDVFCKNKGELLLSIPVRGYSVPEWYCYPSKVFVGARGDISRTRRVKLFNSMFPTNGIIPEILYDHDVLEARVLPRREQFDFREIEFEIKNGVRKASDASFGSDASGKSVVRVNGIEVLTILIELE